MKIALCLHGHFRTFMTCWPSLYRHIILPYKPDIFIASWTDSMGFFIGRDETLNPQTHPGYNTDSPPVTSDYLKSVLDKLNPIDTHLEHFYLKEPVFDMMLNNLKMYHDPDIFHRPKGTLSLNWIRYVSIQMKAMHEYRHNFKYDRVISARWDLHYYEPIDLNLYNPDILICPAPGGRGDGGWGDAPGDVWSTASSDIIDKYGDQFRGIGELIQANKMTLSTHPWQKNWLDYKGVIWENRPEIELKVVR